MVEKCSKLSKQDIKEVVKDIRSATRGFNTVVNSIGLGTGIGPIGGSNSPASKTAIAEQNDKYLKDFEAAKVVMDNAPLDLSRAEKNYYLYNNGKAGGYNIYNTLIMDRFATTAQEFRTNSIDLQQQFMSDLSQALKQYQAQTIFLTQSMKLLQTRTAEHNDLLKNVNYYQKIVQTSERKVVYENKNMDSLYTYRRLMFFIYYAAIIIFIIFGNFIPDKLYSKQSVWLIIVILSIIPLILNIGIKWLFLIYETLSYWFGELPHRDVYSDLGVGTKGTPPAPPGSAITSIINPLASAGAGGGAAAAPIAALIS